MKNKFKFIGLTIFFSILILANNNYIFAQENDSADQQITTEETTISNDVPLVEEENNASFHQIIKQKFIEGGPGFMGIVLLCLILGLALAIERIIYLNMSTTDTDKLLSDVEGALQSGGVDAAKEVCRNTKGPVASIFYQGLDDHLKELIWLKNQLWHTDLFKWVV